jgi:hypothetical protein
MIEKRWKAVPPQLFTADGTADGKILIASDACHLFKVKQQVILKSNTVPSHDILEIKRIMDGAIYVGLKSENIDSRYNLSAYLVADSASIEAIEQKRSSVPFEEFTRAEYEEEPVVAKRVILVDECGDKYNDGNPLPVTIPDVSITVGDLDVQVDGVYDSVNNLDPDNVGLIGHTRAVTPGDPQQNNRLTSITNGDVHALDVSVHNSDGTAVDNTNPLPVTFAEPDIVPTHFEGSVATAGTPVSLTLPNPIQLAFVFNPNKGASANNQLDVLYITIDGSTKKTTVPRGSSRYFPGVFSTFKVDTNNSGTKYEVILWEIP